MNDLSKVALGILYLALAGLVGAGAWWLATNKPASAKSDKPAPPATVTKTIKEEELTTVTLTPEAETRIGVKTGTVEKKAMPRYRPYGGEVTIPVGQSVVVSSPLGGRIKVPEGGLPRPGQVVKKGESVLELLPLLDPLGQANIATLLTDTGGQLDDALIVLEKAKQDLDRANKLFKGDAISRKSVQDAQAVYDQASKKLEAIKDRKKMLDSFVADSKGGTAPPIPINVPENGILRTLSVQPDQNVPSGQPLFEVVDLSTIWVRVALPVDDAEEVNRASDVQVGTLSSQPNHLTKTAKAVTAPPSANPLASTIDLFYELPNADHRLIPGQRLGVSIPLKDSQESLTVPFSSVVFDIYGGTWVFEEVEARKFTRRRVVVRNVANSEAVLVSGPPAKTKVVVEGALELFAAETGFIK